LPTLQKLQVTARQATARSSPSVLQSEFLEVVPPRKLAHTYGPPGVPPATVTYILEAISGTRITIRHVGFKSREFCTSTYLGWESLLEQLATRLAHQC